MEPADTVNTGHSPGIRTRWKRVEVGSKGTTEKYLVCHFETKCILDTGNMKYPVGSGELFNVTVFSQPNCSN